jgi:hypothetical protein
MLRAWWEVTKKPHKHEAESTKHGAESMSTKHEAQSMSMKQRQKNWALIDHLLQMRAPLNISISHLHFPYFQCPTARRARTTSG